MQYAWSEGMTERQWISGRCRVEWAPLMLCTTKWGRKKHNTVLCICGYSIPDLILYQPIWIVDFGFSFSWDLAVRVCCVCTIFLFCLWRTYCRNPTLSCLHSGLVAERFPVENLMKWRTVFRCDCDGNEAALLGERTEKAGLSIY